MYKKVLLATVSLIFVFSTSAFAAHPLTTDDTGTQGKGKFQIEVNSEFTYDKERVFNEDDGDYVTEKTTGGEIATVFTYGALDNLDIFVEAPYVWSKTEVNGVVDPDDPSADADGISDIAIGAKWRFYEHGGVSLGLKPSISLPTGKEEKGLGNGRASYEVLFLVTKELEPWAFHLNLCYAHNEYKLQEDKELKRKGIWKASLAGEVEVIKELKIVADVGIESNDEKGKDTHPAFILGGLIYSITENFDVNLGIKGGLNKPADDRAILAGIALRF